jgi:hypothetical protein
VDRLTTVVVLPTPPFWFAQAMIWPNQVPISVVQNELILAFGAAARFSGWLLKRVLPTRASFGRAPARRFVSVGEQSISGLAWRPLTRR